MAEKLPEIANMVRRQRDIDLDTAALFADFLNLYLNAMKRAGRSIFMPDDAMRILTSVNIVLDSNRSPEPAIDFDMARTKAEGERQK